eukprot:5617627-Ditylum_brightwellii.AAC.1
MNGVKDYKGCLSFMPTRSSLYYDVAVVMNGVDDEGLLLFTSMKNSSWNQADRGALVAQKKRR